MFPLQQEIVSVESLSLKLLDVITILLKYCGNQCNNNDNNETQAVIVDLIATIGFFCANNKGNQVSLWYILHMQLKSYETRFQDLLACEQSSIIIKSLTKLPKNFNIVVYPCLVTIIYKNEEARKSIAREFNVDVSSRELSYFSTIKSTNKLSSFLFHTVLGRVQQVRESQKESIDICAESRHYINYSHS